MDDYTAIMQKLGLPRHCTKITLNMEPDEVPIVHATFYATTDDGKIAIDHDVLRTLSEHFTMVPLHTDDLIIGTYNVDAAIKMARTRIRSAIASRARHA